MFDSVFYPIHANFRAEVPKYVKPQTIKVNLNKLENGGIETIKTALSRATTKALKDLESAIEKKDAKAIENYKFNLIPELERSLLGLWLGGWGIGKKHGSNEIKAQQKKEKANFDEDEELLGADIALIENVYAQEAIANRANTLAQDVAGSQWGNIRGHLLAAVQPQPETGYPISRSELLKRINSELGDGGFGKRAEKIARTELTFAYNSGRLQSYKDSGLVSHVVFLSILDDRRCQVCEDRHGMTIALDDVETIAANTPPMHVNCRCVLSPRLRTPENQDELDTEEKKSKRRRLFDAPPKWLAAGILAAILLTKTKAGGRGVSVPGAIPGAIPNIVTRETRQLVDVALASQIQAIANATKGTAANRLRRKNQTAPIPSQGTIEIQPKVILNGVDLNAASPEEIREALKEFLKPNQLDELISYLQENKVASVDDLLSVKGITKKSKVFKVLQELADKDKLRIELQSFKTPSDLWLKNLGFSRSEAKEIFEELKDKPAESWDDLRKRLKKRGISTDKLQRAIDKLKSIEVDEKKQVVGLDDFIETTAKNIIEELPEDQATKLIKQREVGLQRRREALQEIRELELELAQVRLEGSKFNVHARRMSKRNPKAFIAPEEIKIREARQRRIQTKLEKAQQRELELSRQLEQAKLGLNSLDIPNLTPAAISRTQAVEVLGIEGKQLSGAVRDLSESVAQELDTQTSKGFINAKKRLTTLEQANTKATMPLAPVDKLIQKVDLEDLKNRLNELQIHYKNLSDPLYPDNYFGRDIQNELVSLRAELKRVRAEIDNSLGSVQRSEQILTNATNQVESTMGRIKQLKVGTQLEKQAKDLETQIQDWETRVKRTQNFEKTTEPFNPLERQQPLEQMGRDAIALKSQVPLFRREADKLFRPKLDQAKGTISELTQRREALEELQQQINGVLREAESLPLTKSQMPEPDVQTYNAAVELRKISREITEETTRLKTLAGATKVNLDDSLKSQNKLYQQYEKQRFGDETTPSWEKNLSPAVESRLSQIEQATKKLEVIGKSWNLGYLADLGEKVQVGTDAAGKAIKVRKWLDDNGLAPEDLSLSPIGGRKVGLEAIRELADEVIKQYGVIRNNTQLLKKDTQFKIFTDKGLLPEQDFLKWAEEQANYWQGQKQRITSDNWQGSSYDRVDNLWKSLQGKKASDLEARQSIKLDDVQGQLRKTVGKYQDWLRKYVLLKEKGDLSPGGIRALDDAQKNLLAEQNKLLEQIDNYNFNAQELVNDNLENTREIWEKVKRDSQQPVYFDVKGKAIERGELLKQIDEVNKQVNSYLSIRERKVEPMTYDAKKAIPLIDTRNKLTQELSELDNQISGLQKQINELTQARKGTKRVETQLSKLQQQQQQKQRQLNEVIQETRDLRQPPQRYQQIQEVKSQIAATEKRMRAIEAEITPLRQEITTLKEQPLDGSASGRTRQNRVKALESSIDRKNQELFREVEIINNQRRELGKLRSES